MDPSGLQLWTATFLCVYFFSEVYNVDSPDEHKLVSLKEIYNLKTNVTVTTVWSHISYSMFPSEEHLSP